MNKQQRDRYVINGIILQKTNDDESFLDQLEMKPSRQRREYKEIKQNEHRSKQRKRDNWDH